MLSPYVEEAAHASFSNREQRLLSEVGFVSQASQGKARRISEKATYAPKLCCYNSSAVGGG